MLPYNCILVVALFKVRQYNRITLTVRGIKVAIKQSAGDYLREKMADAGGTQKELCASSGLRQSVVSAVVTGRMPVSLKVAKAIEDGMMAMGFYFCGSQLIIRQYEHRLSIELKDFKDFCNSLQG